VRSTQLDRTRCLGQPRLDSQIGRARIARILLVEDDPDDGDLHGYKLFIAPFGDKG
jgi:hypothetical protein